MKTTTKVTLPLADVPAVIRDSVKATLAAHGLTLTDRMLVELGNNVTAALQSVDEVLNQPGPGVLIAVGHTLRALAATGQPNEYTAPALSEVGEWLVELVTPAAGKAA